MNNKEKLHILKSECGFNKLCELSISTETNRLSFGHIKKNQYVYIIYAICIDDNLVYIGKSQEFHKRIDTYKNAKYWKNAWVSNKNKTKWLENAVKRGSKVEFFYRSCNIYNPDTPVGVVDLTSMHEEETRFIKKFNPPWNIQHNKGI